ncbi:zinc finger protein 583 [Drosophila mojavensis]|uniref:C2H2-type domain-containing protein n=1 Tax=Drosophila mojavensis TaxID=7230 RepID=B4KQA3_DROMO|nr:zinc finger protein 583 [Drosophila mojavensis]EDW09231.2 uncharacterized protein Dmoj_GI19158 [Drosophila mojavensis]
MDYQPMSTKFELPKSPASTLHNDESDDDVEYIGTILPPGGQQTIIDTKWSPNQNVDTMASLLATPPLSPEETHTQHTQMPILTAMLTQNTCPNSNFEVQIPCYLCKRPFHDIKQLRDHLTMHASQLLIHLRQGATHVPNLYPFPPTYATDQGNRNGFVEKAPPQSQEPHQQQQQPQQVKTTQVACDKCGKLYICKASLKLHQRLHHTQHPNENHGRWLAGTSYKCHICRKSYKRECFLQKHIRYKHGPQPCTNPLDEAVQTTPSVSSSERPQRCVWSTKMFNAVAAANYNPATETASKYLPPDTSAASETQNPTMKPLTKRKYPLRSPHFNPNLWIDNDAYIE